MKLLKIVALSGLLCLQSNGESMKEARLIYDGYSAQEIAKATSEELAKTAPMRVDVASYIISSTHIDSTVVVNTIIEEKALIDITRIDIQKMTKKEKGKFANELIESMKKLQLNSICTTPMTRVALEKGVNYKYLYRWDNFTYLGEIDIDNKDCVNSKL
ncbi:MAG: hypothetical protein PHX44_05130 [Sulfurimonas sp.]|uniref:hypothetical protein n=1 Tax=Sulfurimonas sp. TaxID=2022749 RepID=UPI00260ABD1E|nr:hypothetical protein [Sulfurimonas sp.]MDD2652419.1 hypothetical protein [Sulfurimonas sp.]MDD3451105.1 hypothetical protein [Sulfurimonas sp.]